MQQAGPSVYFKCKKILSVCGLAECNSVCTWNWMPGVILACWLCANETMFILLSLLHKKVKT